MPFIAMPLLKGASLEDWFRQKQKAGSKTPLTERQILKLGREIAKGLAAAHEQGLIHRDIKPANVWLDAGAGGRVKILDFGLARLSEGEQHLTQSGVILGTPSYMAPEQAQGFKLDGRTDLFSLGVVLYRLCTGELPFTGDNPMSVLMALASHQPPPVRDLNPAISPALAELVMGLLVKDPAQRIGSANDVVQRIGDIERGAKGHDQPLAETIAYQPGGGRRTAGTNRAARGKWIAAALAGFVVLAVASWQIIIKVTDKDGNVTEIKAPKGAKVEVVKDGKTVAKEPPKPPDWPAHWVEKKWVDEVSKLPPHKQVEAVKAKLVERNPGFDGQVNSVIAGGDVTEIEFQTRAIVDISPLRALPKLERLRAHGPPGSIATLADLSPLQGMQLKELSIDTCGPVRDLSPLQGMKLTSLLCGGTRVSDLSPLQGMPLTNLHCWGTQVSDLSPLKGMPLTNLNCAYTQVSDLTPLQGMKLTSLHCGATQVSDLSPLKGMPLRVLHFTPKNITKGLDMVRAMPGLTTIGIDDSKAWPAAEFWKRYDAGEFKE